MKSFIDYLIEKMDPRKHAVERDGKFVVVDKDGETVKTFDNKEAAEKYAVANHDSLMKETVELDEREFEVSRSGHINAKIGNRRDLSPKQKEVARRSLDRKTATAQRQAPKGSSDAHNVLANQGRRYRPGSKQPAAKPGSDRDRSNSISQSIQRDRDRGYSTEDVQEACWDSHVQRGTKMKGGKVVPNCVPRNEGTEEQVDEVMTGTRDPQGSHRHTYQKSGKGGMSLAALRARRKEQEDNNPAPEKNKSNEEVSVEEAKKKIKVKLDPKKKIGYEVKSVGPGGKTTVTKRRDMPGREDVGEASGAWQRKEGKNKEGGLNAAGRASYERENPGSDLKAPVSSKTASKNPDGKAANRRKSFCARMGGMKGAMKDEKGRPTRKALALRKWDC